MAIYRKGQASMDADGYITGYGTEWKTALTLIRPGATIVFATNPVAYATISEIVNDTSLRATSTGGDVVPQSDYVILLHDSITVDGLAQDVAETLRYYQGKESMIESFIDFLKTFDWEKLESIDAGVKENSAEAAGSAANALQSEQNAFVHSQNASASASAAATSENAAGQSAQAAQVSESNANSYREAAENSANSAAAHDQAALASKNAAAASEANAKESETKAAESENNAANSEGAAAASEAAAHLSELNAATSAAASDASKNESQAAAVISTNASNEANESKNAAAHSAASAKSDADRAEELADQLDATNLMRKDANLSDVVNVGQARDNLDLNWLRTFGENHIASSPDLSHRLVLGNDGLFVWQTSEGQTVPIAITSGGTGSTSPEGARVNLQLDRFAQSGEQTYMYAQNKKMKVYVDDSGDWGAYDDASGTIKPLPVNRGGTGAIDASGARTNLELGSSATKNVGSNSGDVVTSGSTQPLYRTTLPAVGYNDLGDYGYKAKSTLSPDSVAKTTTTLVQTSGWTLGVSYGIYNSSDNSPENAAHVLIMTDGAGYTRRYYFYNNGDIVGPSGKFYSEKNTTVDANGFIKSASPVVKIYANGRYETNDESEGVSVSRQAIGEYLITGCLGLNADSSWGGSDGGFEIPVDRNKQPRLWLDYEVNADGSILMKTYHRVHSTAPDFAQNRIGVRDENGYFTETVKDGDPVDIPSDTFVSVRLEMPASSF